MGSVAHAWKQNASYLTVGQVEETQLPQQGKQCAMVAETGSCRSHLRAMLLEIIGRRPFCLQERQGIGQEVASVFQLLADRVHKLLSATLFLRITIGQVG